MKTRAAFSIAYEGSAVDGGEIDVRVLAGALLGLGRLFEGLNEVANGDEASTSVVVRATRPGSFEVGIEVLTTFRQAVAALWEKDKLSTASDLAGLLADGGTVANSVGVGVLGILHWLKGRKPEKVEASPQAPLVVINIGSERLEVKREAYEASVHPAVRRGIREIFEPLKRPGITEVVVRGANRQVVHRVTSDQFSWYDDVSLDEQVVDTSEHRRVFDIVSPTFQRGNQWRLSDGRARYIPIDDEAFLDEVERGEARFGAGDTLVCVVRVTQTRNVVTRELKTEERVVRVLQHIPRAENLSMFDPGPPNTEPG